LIYCIQLKFAYFSILDEIQALIWDITFQLQLKLGTILKYSNTAVLEYMIFNSLSMKSSDSNTNMMLHCKWSPSLFPEGEKSLNPFVHQNMLFLHGTRLSCPPCNSPRSPREQKWNPSSHDITYHSAFLLLHSSQRRLHQESLSHNAAQAAANNQRATGTYRDTQGP